MSLCKSYYHSADIIFIMYDITSVQSYSNLKIWLKDVLLSTSKAYRILLGNKRDRESQRVIPYNVAQVCGTVGIFQIIFLSH